MKPELIKQILDMYGLTCKKLYDTEKGYRNQSHPIVLGDGQKVNLILYKDEPAILTRIKNANYVADYAANRGFPARKTFDTRVVCLQTSQHRRYAALYHYLPGSTIPWEGYTKNHLKLLGLAMSNLHALLKDLDQPASLPSVSHEYAAITDRMTRYFGDPLVQKAIADKLQLYVPPATFERLSQLLHYCHRLPKQQVLHMDFVRSNLLFTNLSPGSTEHALRLDNLALSGALDFEKTSIGHPAFDIARSLAFLLVDCKYKTESQIRKYFLHSGYSKRGQADLPKVTLHVASEKLNLCEALLDLFLMYDFYKFLRHNPYESLAQNEHFIRTRDILLRHRLITSPTLTAP